MPYIPKMPFSMKSIGILSTSQRETPRKKALSPLPKAWKRKTVKKLMNMSGVASTLMRRKSVPSSTVPASVMKALMMYGADSSYIAMLSAEVMRPTFSAQSMTAFMRLWSPEE